MYNQPQYPAGWFPGASSVEPDWRDQLKQLMLYGGLGLAASGRQGGLGGLALGITKGIDASKQKAFNKAQNDYFEKLYEEDKKRQAAMEAQFPAMWSGLFPGSDAGTPPLAAAATQPAQPPAPGGDPFQAILSNETGGMADPAHAVSSAGALGTAQMLPGTFNDMASAAGIPPQLRDPFNSGQSQAMGRRYFDQQSQTFGDPILAAGAYHAGEKNFNDYLQKAGYQPGMDHVTLINSMATFAPKTADYMRKFAEKTSEGLPQAQPIADTAPQAPVGLSPQELALAEQEANLAWQSGDYVKAMDIMAATAKAQREAAEKAATAANEPPKTNGDWQWLPGQGWVPMPKAAPEPPQGYKFNADGTLSAIPGGPADKQAEAPPGYKFNSDGTLGPIEGGPASSSAKAGGDIKVAEQLRGELNTLSKEVRTVQAAYKKVASAADKPSSASGASDMALIFAFMKILDPTSAVREAEYATAENSGSIPQSVTNMYNKALNGNFLTEEQRKDFKVQAYQAYLPYEQQYKSNAEFYTGIAKRQKIDPQDVIMPFEFIQPPEAAAPPPTGNPDSILDPFLTPGMY